VFSSRRIQKRLAEDVAFRVLAAGNQPDFRTISDFRKLHLKALADVTPGVRDGSAEVGTSGFGWEQSKSQREQAQGHELWTDGGGRDAAAGGSARVESFEWVSAIKSEGNYGSCRFSVSSFTTYSRRYFVSFLRLARGK
jgi:hypothetical protein